MMRPEQRVVTKLPLEELWNASGSFHHAHCVGTIAGDELGRLLKHGPVHFVVADVGFPLLWVDPAACFTFWRQEVKRHLAGATNGRFSVDEFPDQYAYVARHWETELERPVIVLEKHH